MLHVCGLVISPGITNLFFPSLHKCKMLCTWRAGAVLGDLTVAQLVVLIVCLLLVIVVIVLLIVYVKRKYK